MARFIRRISAVSNSIVHTSHLCEGDYTNSELTELILQCLGSEVNVIKVSIQYDVRRHTKAFHLVLDSTRQKCDV